MPPSNSSIIVPNGTAGDLPPTGRIPLSQPQGSLPCQSLDDSIATTREPSPAEASYL
jgi:hypothetical protein